MFRATMSPSPAETTVFMRSLVLVILCGWLFGMHVHNPPERVEICKYTKNKLCTKLALFTVLYRDTRSTKHKNTSACPILTNEKDIKRYDSGHRTALYQMHRNMLKLENEHWYKHVHKLIETRLAGWIIVLWNPKLHKDRTIPNNKPDTIIRNNEEKHEC